MVSRENHGGRCLKSELFIPITLNDRKKLRLTMQVLLLRLTVISFEFLVISVSSTEIIHNYEEKVKHNNSNNIHKKIK